MCAAPLRDERTPDPNSERASTCINVTWKILPGRLDGEADASAWTIRGSGHFHRHGIQTTPPRVGGDVDGTNQHLEVQVIRHGKQGVKRGYPADAEPH